MIKITLLVPFSKTGKEMMIEDEGLSSTAELLAKLDRMLGQDFRKKLFDEKENIKDSVMILSGGRNISDSYRTEELHKDYTFCSVISGG